MKKVLFDMITWVSFTIIFKNYAKNTCGWYTGGIVTHYYA